MAGLHGIFVPRGISRGRDYFYTYLAAIITDNDILNTGRYHKSLVNYIIFYCQLHGVLKHF